MGFTDTQTSMLPGKPESAMCVQSLDDSRGFANRITYRISLRSSSLWEPRHPPLKVVLDYVSSVALVIVETKTSAPAFRFRSFSQFWFVVKETD